MKINISADSSFLSFKILNFILQPLVENAIVHGVEKKVGFGVIEVNIIREGKYLKYIVSDDGVGTDSDRVNQLLSENGETNHIFALKNINERIKLKYGNEYGITFISKIGFGTTVTVIMPINEIDTPK